MAIGLLVCMGHCQTHIRVPAYLPTYRQTGGYVIAYVWSNCQTQMHAPTYLPTYRPCFG